MELSIVAERCCIMKFKQKNILIEILVVLLFLPQPFLVEANDNAWPLSDAVSSEYDGSGVRIALIDTGVTCKYIDDSHVSVGKNYVFPDKSTYDYVGHGTAIAGIILGSEKLGLRGIASDAEIVPLVYYSRYPSGVPVNGGIDAICKAIYDAIDVYDCQIINISSGVTSDNDKLREAIEYAEEKNILVVSSVGNSNCSSPEDIYYPAAYETVIGVGSVNEENEVAGFSQRNNSVKLVAPGTDIPTAHINNRSKPVKVSGTSYSAAFVTGTAALLLEANPELSAVQLREILFNTAKDLEAEGYDTGSGWGLLNVSDALSEAQNYILSTSENTNK